MNERFDKTLADKLYRRDGIHTVLDRLDYVRQTGERRWRAKCPVHGGESHDSLSIALGDSGQLLLYCHGGCDYVTVKDALGIQASDNVVPFNRDKHRRKTEQLELEKAEKEFRISRVAFDTWQAATECSTHEYLERKQVPPYGLRVDENDNLLIPRMMGQELWNLERVFADGSKRPLVGGRVKGTYYRIGKPDGRVYIAEGYADAATLHLLTGHCAVCTFGGTNMPRVARTIAQRSTDKIIIAADHDPAGIKAAEASKPWASDIIIPPDVGTDWNDCYIAHGADTTIREITL